MKLSISCKWLIIVLVLAGSGLTNANAQTRDIPSHREPYSMDSGLHDGRTDLKSTTYLAYRTVIRVSGAPWLRLHFSAADLGRAKVDSLGVLETLTRDIARKMSYIQITSLQDGGTQRLDAWSLSHWSRGSAYFNGDAVEVTVHVARGDKQVFARINEITVGEVVSDRGLGKVLDYCNEYDERVAWDDPAVGRVLGITSGDTTSHCTAWIAPNRALLSAGHCASAFFPLDVVEFNVPDSEGGSPPSIVFADPDDQYSVRSNSITSSPYTPGDDWAVFDCFANSNTGLKPGVAQQAAHRLFNGNYDEDSVRVTGYGGDSGQAHRTLQSDMGSFEGLTTNGPSDVVIEHKADDSGGSSGGPILDATETYAIGIHNAHFCNRNDPNAGVSFKNDNLEDAIEDFRSSIYKYVDNGHPSTQEYGTVFDPYNTVAAAINPVPARSIISIHKGYYNESVTISKPMTITAPVGMVTIGASGMGKVTAAGDIAAIAAPKNPENSLVPTEYALSPAYPNPFNPRTTVKYALKDDVHATMKVYDLLGREVLTLVDAYQPAAYYSVVWNGRDAAGRQVASGIYFARLLATPTAGVTPGYTKSIKMLLLK